MRKPARRNRVLVCVMTVRRRLTPWAVLLPALFISACLPTRHAPTPEAPPPRRLVLALDGIDYRDIVAARQRGLFSAFREPSRLISTFPSISDIAWHEIFGVQAPRGYQRIFYSLGQNAVIGAPLDAIRPIEFEDRMDMAFGAKFHHLGAYLISNTIARREVDVAVRDFFKYAGRPTVYVYNVGPDALQHTRGDLPKYLDHLDLKLRELMAEYRRRTGRELEIVVLSDHGHNKGVEAQFLPVVKSLQARGFRASDALRQPTDIAFSVDGVTTGFGVFCDPDSVAAVADALVATEGVDVVSTRITPDRFVVRRGSTRAAIDRRPGRSGDWFRYVPVDGDPLAYGDILARMRTDGVLDRDGFADSRSWIAYSGGATYPAALERIVRGHTVVTLNPAPILVSVADGYRVGLGMVSIANRMRPLGGTHGALRFSDALGVVMTTFRDTRDDLTSSVRWQLDGFLDLGPVRYARSGAGVTTATLLGSDERGPFYRQPDSLSIAARAAALHVWLTESDRRWADPGGAFYIEFRERPTNGQRSKLLATSHLPMRRTELGAVPSAVERDGLAARGPMSATPAREDGWIGSADGRHFTLSFARFAAALSPNAVYELRIMLDRAPTRPSDTRSTTRELANLTLHTNARGELWPY